jgi:hypothetical protein
MVQPKPSPYEPSPVSTLEASLRPYITQELRKLSRVIADQAIKIEELQARVTELEGP